MATPGDGDSPPKAIPRGPATEAGPSSLGDGGALTAPLGRPAPPSPASENALVLDEIRRLREDQVQLLHLLQQTLIADNNSTRQQRILKPSSHRQPESESPIPVITSSSQANIEPEGGKEEKDEKDETWFWKRVYPNEESFSEGLPSLREYLRCSGPFSANCGWDFKRVVQGHLTATPAGGPYNIPGEFELRWWPRAPNDDGVFAKGYYDKIEKGQSPEWRVFGFGRESSRWLPPEEVLSPPASGDDRCGQVWRITAKSVAVDAQVKVVRVLPMSTVALIPILLGGCGIEMPIKSLHWFKMSCGHSFLESFCKPWPANESRLAHHTNFRRWMPCAKHIALQYHLRSFTVRPDIERLMAFSVRGLACSTESGSLEFAGQRLDFVESRASFALYTDPFSSKRRFGEWNIVIVESSWDVWPHDDTQALDRHSLRWAAGLSGVSLFQSILHSRVKTWSANWSHTLSRIDDMLSNKLVDVLDPQIRTSLMYDNASLERSELYFTLLQVLRIFGECIATSLKDLDGLATGSMDDLKVTLQNLQEDDDGDEAGEDKGKNHVNCDGDGDGAIHEEREKLVRIIEANWEILLAYHKKEGGALLARVAKYTDDVNSLRDGLFNAQSVREAIKSSQVNQYLLVFTVVTIIFLPPSFVAGFFGMHLFDMMDTPSGTTTLTPTGSDSVPTSLPASSDSGTSANTSGTERTQRIFWIVFCAVSAVTWLFASVALTSVNRNMQSKARASLGAVAGRFRRRGASRTTKDDDENDDNGDDDDGRSNENRNRNDNDENKTTTRNWLKRVKKKEQKGKQSLHPPAASAGSGSGVRGDGVVSEAGEEGEQGNASSAGISGGGNGSGWLARAIRRKNGAGQDKGKGVAVPEMSVLPV